MPVNYHIHVYIYMRARGPARFAGRREKFVRRERQRNRERERGREWGGKGAGRRQGEEGVLRAKNGEMKSEKMKNRLPESCMGSSAEAIRGGRVIPQIRKLQEIGIENEVGW